MPYSSCDKAIDVAPNNSKKEFADHLVFTMLKSTPFFYDLTQEEFCSIAKEIKVHHFKRNALVVREKDAGDSLFFVTHGILQTCMKDRKTQNNVNVSIVEKGEFFGECSLLAGRIRPTTIRALSDCELIEVPGQVYQKIAFKYSSTRRFLIDICRQYDRKTASSLDRLAINRRKHQRVSHQGKVVFQKYNPDTETGDVLLRKGLLVDLSEEGISFFIHKKEMSGSISELIGTKCKAKIYIKRQNSSLAVKTLGKIVGLETGVQRQRGDLGNFLISRMKFLFVDKVDKKALKRLLQE